MIGRALLVASLLVLGLAQPVSADESWRRTQLYLPLAAPVPEHPPPYSCEEVWRMTWAVAGSTWTPEWQEFMQKVRPLIAKHCWDRLGDELKE